MPSRVTLFARLSVFAGCLTFAASLAAVQGAAPPAHPLRLTLRIDRAKYFEYEPVLAHWSLANAGPRPLRVPKDAAYRRLYFEFRTGDGDWIQLHPTVA